MIFADSCSKLAFDSPALLVSSLNRDTAAAVARIVVIGEHSVDAAPLAATHVSVSRTAAAIELLYFDDFVAIRALFIACW